MRIPSRRLIKYGFAVLVLFFVIAALSSGSNESPSGAQPTKKPGASGATAQNITHGWCLAHKDEEVCDVRRINTIAWEDSPYISPDGKKLYFMFISWNLMDMLAGRGKAYMTGLVRPGHTENADNPFAEQPGWYMSEKLSGGRWSEPVRVFDGCCAMSRDNTTWYYQKGGQFGSTDIHTITRNGSVWGAPKNLGANINTAHTEDNPHATDQGVLYWTSDRPDGLGGKDIWFATLQNGVWGKAQNAGPTINSSADEDQVWISPDGTTMFYNRGTTLLKSTMTRGAWGTPEPLVFAGGHVDGAEPSLTDDMKTLYFAQVTPGAKELLIVSSKLQSNGTWSSPVPVD